MDKKIDNDWVLFTKETKRKFSNATWIPLRSSRTEKIRECTDVGYIEEYFGCGSVAFYSEDKITADNLGWEDIGVGCDTRPYVESDHYSPLDEYEYWGKVKGIHLVFDYTHPVSGTRELIVNPDLIIALRLVKEGDVWLRPEENYVEVIREIKQENDNNTIEIKREFLADYLAARGLILRLSYYRQRVINVQSLENSPFSSLTNYNEERNDGKFSLFIRSLEDTYGGNWLMTRAWRTDVDDEEDAPVMGKENNDNVEFETHEGHYGGYSGVRVEGEFWRNEWIENTGKSIRIRGDKDPNLPMFIIETDGTREASEKLNNEDVGRWLWFRASIVNEILSLRGFSMKWCTAETAVIYSTSGYQIHFGINQSDLITVYAFDIARLPPWEQHIWSAKNVVPNGKVSSELLDSQVRCTPANTRAVETLLFAIMKELDNKFNEVYGFSLYTKEIEDAVTSQISRFSSTNEESLLSLAKNLIKVFSERLNKNRLRELSTHPKKEKLGSNKLLESIVAEKIGEEEARKMFAVIAGTYDLRIGDAHATNSKLDDAFQLAGIDRDASYLRQGKKLINNFGYSIFCIFKAMFR